MTSAAFLSLLQIMDSQFPIGSFAHSSGLETYALMNLSKEDLAELLAVNLACGFGRLDLAACALAYRADSDDALYLLCEELTAWKPVKGLRETSLKLGKRFQTLIHRIYPQAVDKFLDMPHQAVVLGKVARNLQIELEPLLLAFAQSSLLSQLTAATRCMPLSPEQAQEILLGLQESIAEVVADVLADPRANLYAATPALDIRAQQQAHLYTRLFQS